MNNKPDYTDYLLGTFFAIFIGAMLGFIYILRSGGF